MVNKPDKFETAIKRLETIVTQLESENLELDKSIELFEEGIELSKFCKKKLEEAEQKIEIILKKDTEKTAGKESVENYEVKPLFEVYPEDKVE